MTILCARCGAPVRMTSVGCYGHLDGQPQVRQAGASKPHAARAASTGPGVAHAPSRGSRAVSRP